jgi:hypothetical protein
MINVNWRKLLLKGSLWLSLEVAFSSIGIDYLIDYSEYIFQQNQISFIGVVSETVTISCNNYLSI